MNSEHLRVARASRHRTLVLSAALTVPLLALAGCGTTTTTGSNGAGQSTPPSTGTETGTQTGPGEGTSGGTSGAPTTPRSTDPRPSAPLPSPRGGSTPAARTVRTAVYFLHGEKVSPAPRTVTAPTTATGALRALLAGPSSFERRQGRTTAIPSGTRLRSLVIHDRVATVDLSGRYDDGGGSLSMRARLAQVVFTATRFSGVQKVRFEIDGKAVRQFGGEGVVLNGPVGRADFEDVSPAVLMESPLIGDTVRTPLWVWGTANTFEAVFRLKVTDAAKHTAADVRVRATSGTGTRGGFDVTIPYRATRSGPGLLTAYFLSPKDGRPVTVDTVPLTVNR
ncbi:GerMN domain-containing protein [Streptomyces sp. NPDC101152]|uniref:GerMN domain-containing protein n=1 Tax=Streptomyces sp. NPDC101152 TaxID=3366116 RepID=UPI00380DE528